MGAKAGPLLLVAGAAAATAASGGAASPLLAAGLAAAGTAVTAVGAIQQASSEARAAEAQGQEAARAAMANAAIAQQQAQIAREQASQERRRAALSAEVFAREVRRRQGTRVSAIGASGLQLSGSALDVLADAAMSAEQERLFIIAEGAERARARLAGARIEEMTSAEFMRIAAAERQVGRAVAGAARTFGGIRAAGTILTGASQIGFGTENALAGSPSFRRLFGRRTGSVPVVSGFREHLA